MPDSVRERVIALIANAKQLAPEDVSLERSFAELGLDSLDAFNLIGDLEDEFGIEIPNEEVMGLRTLDETIAAVEKLVAERRGA